MRSFTRITGWIFFILAFLSLFTNHVWGLIQFDTVQNIFRFGIGILAMAISRPTVDPSYSRTFCIIVSPTLCITGIISFGFPAWFGMHFEAVENLLHLALGAFGCSLLLRELRAHFANQKESSTHSESSSESLNESSSHNL